mmetsp:Transcript_22075/g.58394  ORF Transcript_22075/g.58394 Transcript_22075/m.58394 type:complete len:220 (-) Transcript_22075:651-1310(-)
MLVAQNSRSSCNVLLRQRKATGQVHCVQGEIPIESELPERLVEAAFEESGGGLLSFRQRPIESGQPPHHLRFVRQLLLPHEFFHFPPNQRCLSVGFSASQAVLNLSQVQKFRAGLQLTSSVLATGTVRHRTFLQQVHRKVLLRLRGKPFEVFQPCCHVGLQVQRSQTLDDQPPRQGNMRQLQPTVVQGACGARLPRGARTTVGHERFDARCSFFVATSV